ncbi:MAG: hypothetical protein L0Z53_10310 [Acidobacteriales bacterium]|nr:hypothetical protein [Terriglobales bacterium]
MKRLLLCLLLCAIPAFAQQGRPEPLLPPVFSGWERTGTPQVSKDATQADRTNAGLLQEYGFEGLESATYARDGRRLQVKAARFADATGAYGAFTFYNQPEMQVEQIGDQAVSNIDRVIFRRGNVLVTAFFQEPTAMSAAELRSLAEKLPPSSSGSRHLPTVADYLPRPGLQKNSIRYVNGPKGFERANLALPEPVVDFAGSSPELAVGRYRSDRGEATLAVISYPTPQIAEKKIRAIQELPQASGAVPELFARRSGPIVAVVGGEISPGEARSLLESVNYIAQVTWNERAPVTTGQVKDLIVNSFILIGAIMLIFIVLGGFFGGARVLLRKALTRGRFQSGEEREIIRLNLRE